jgi:N,N'-diacetyllegionaminate synthase
MNINIENKIIGNGSPTFIVAEAGLNHNGELDIAKKMINAVYESGADAIKFQTFRTEEFLSKSSEYFDFFKNTELSFSDFEELNEYAKRKNIIFFSAPFDLSSAEFLTKIQVPCFKIASSDLTNIPLIKKIANSQKPMIISTGLANLEEIENTVNYCKRENNDKIILLHSVSNYPTNPMETNLRAMDTLRKKFQCPVGYSDNGDSSLVDLVAVSMGANIIEKHFTLDKSMRGPDHSFSIEPNNLKKLILDIRLIEKMKGSGDKKPQNSEIDAIKSIRKSLTAKMDIMEGQKISLDNVAIKRPQNGIEPKYLEQIIGKSVKRDIPIDTPINFEDLLD